MRKGNQNSKRNHNKQIRSKGKSKLSLQPKLNQHKNQNQNQCSPSPKRQQQNLHQNPQTANRRLFLRKSSQQKNLRRCHHHCPMSQPYTKAQTPRSASADLPALPSTKMKSHGRKPAQPPRATCLSLLQPRLRRQLAPALASQTKAPQTPCPTCPSWQPGPWEMHQQLPSLPFRRPSPQRPRWTSTSAILLPLNTQLHQRSTSAT